MNAVQVDAVSIQQPLVGNTAQAPMMTAKRTSPTGWHPKHGRSTSHSTNSAPPRASSTKPLDVVAIAAPRNAPMRLIFHPLSSVFAAGNPAMVKPSELNPRDLCAVRALVPEYFDTAELATVTAGPRSPRRSWRKPSTICTGRSRHPGTWRQVPGHCRRRRRVRREPHHYRQDAQRRAGVHRPGLCLRPRTATRRLHRRAAPRRRRAAPDSARQPGLHRDPQRPPLCMAHRTTRRRPRQGHDQPGHRRRGRW